MKKSYTEQHLELENRIYKLLCKHPYNVIRNNVETYAKQLRYLERSLVTPTFED